MKTTLNKYMYGAALLSALFFAGCSDNDDPQPQPGELEIVSPTSKTIVFDAEATSSATIVFRSTEAWTAEIEGTGFAVSATSGNGSETNQTLEVTAQPNINETEIPGTLTITSGDKELSIAITQAAAEAPSFDQAAANAALAVNRFTPFNVASLDEEAGTVEFCTEVNNTSSGWFEWNEEWPGKTYSNGGKEYRVPTALEIQLLMPGYDGLNHVYFSGTVDNSLEESLPDDILGGQGGDGTSYFRTSAEEIEVGTDPQMAYGVYALRFMGTAQRSAYFYRWYNTGSEADAHLSIRIKAVADDNCTLDKIADNDAFWSDEYIEFKLPACGMNFGGEPLLIGYNGDYWTSTSGGFNQENPEISEYAMCMTFTDTAGYISDSSKTNTGNLRLVEAE